LNVEESTHVVFDEVVDLKENSFKSNKKTAGDEKYIQKALDEMYLNENPPPQPEDPKKCWKSPRGLSLDNVIGDISKGVMTINILYECSFCFTN